MAGEREAALRARDARLASLEARYAASEDLAGQHLAETRAGRDEELERCREEAAAAAAAAAEERAALVAGAPWGGGMLVCLFVRQRDDIGHFQIRAPAAAPDGRSARERCAEPSRRAPTYRADCEAKLAAARGAEGELRSGTRRLREQVEAERARAARAEGRAAEKELGAARVVTQFEGALGTLRQMEGQYEVIQPPLRVAASLNTGPRLAGLSPLHTPRLFELSGRDDGIAR